MAAVAADSGSAKAERAPGFSLSLNTAMPAARRRGATSLLEQRCGPRGRPGRRLDLRLTAGMRPTPAVASLSVVQGLVTAEQSAPQDLLDPVQHGLRLRRARNRSVGGREGMGGVDAAGRAAVFGAWAAAD